jgi:hypothetical protein
LVLHGESEAGIDTLPIDQNGAGAARPLIASLLRAEEVQVFAQKIEKRCANIHLPVHFAAIDNPAHCALRLTQQAD